MNQKTEVEIDKAALLKAARFTIRLKHSLAADAEIAKVLPQLEKQIDAALATGQPLSLTPGDIINDL